MKESIDKAEFKTKLHDGMSTMIGGLLVNGTPERTVGVLVECGVKDLMMIVNDISYPDRGCGRLIANKQVKHLIVSHIDTNPTIAEQMSNGELEVEFSPQGTPVERIRVGGCGLGGVLTTTELGTATVEGKKAININGQDYLLELPLRAGMAFIKGTIGNKTGNLVYKGATQNFQPLMVIVAGYVVAEIDELAPVGQTSPEVVYTSGVFVDYISE